MPTIEDGMEVDKKPVVHFFDSGKITERTLSGAGTKVVKRTRQNIEELLNLYDEKTEEITNPRARKMRRTTDTKGFMENFGKVVPCITSTRSPQGLSIVKAKLKNYSTIDDPQAKWIVPPHSLVFARRTQGVDGIEAFSDVQNFQNDLATTSIYTLLGASLEDGLDAEQFHKQHEARRYFSVAVQGVVSLHCDAEICKNWTFGDPVFIATRPFSGKTPRPLTERDVFRLQPYDTTHFQFLNWGNYRVGFFVEQIDKTLGGIRVKLDIANQIDYRDRGTASNNNFTKRFENAAKQYENLKARISGMYTMAKEQSIENTLSGGSSGTVTYDKSQYRVEESLGELYDDTLGLIEGEYEDFLESVNFAATNLNLNPPRDIVKRVATFKFNLEYFSLVELLKTQKSVTDESAARSVSVPDAKLSPEEIQKKEDSNGDSFHNLTLEMFKQLRNAIDSITLFESEGELQETKTQFSRALDHTVNYYSEKHNIYLEDRQTNYRDYCSEYENLREWGNDFLGAVQEFISELPEIEEERKSETSSVAEGQGNDDTKPVSPQATKRLDELIAATEENIAAVQETVKDLSTPSSTDTGKSETAFVGPAFARPKLLEVNDELKAEQQKVLDAAIDFLPTEGRGVKRARAPARLLTAVRNVVSPKRSGGKEGATDEQNQEPLYEPIKEFAENLKKKFDVIMDAKQHRSVDEFIQKEFEGLSAIYADTQTQPDDEVDEKLKAKYRKFFQAVENYMQYVTSV